MLYTSLGATAQAGRRYAHNHLHPESTDIPVHVCMEVLSCPKRSDLGDNRCLHSNVLAVSPSLASFPGLCLVMCLVCLADTKHRTTSQRPGSVRIVTGGVTS